MSKAQELMDTIGKKEEASNPDMNALDGALKMMNKISDSGKDVQKAKDAIIKLQKRFKKED